MVAELRAHCGEHCREHERRGYQQALTEVTPRVVEVGPLRIDLTAKLVAVNGIEVHLTPTEWRILAELAERRGQPVDSDALRDAVWGDEWYSDNILRSNIARLRAQLREGGRWIVTRVGYGYLLADAPHVKALPKPAAPRQPRRPGWYGAPLLPGQWSRDHDACRVCGTTEYVYHAHGVCRRRACLRAARG